MSDKTILQFAKRVNQLFEAFGIRAARFVPPDVEEPSPVFFLRVEGREYLSAAVRDGAISEDEIAGLEAEMKDFPEDWAGFRTQVALHQIPEGIKLMDLGFKPCTCAQGRGPVHGQITVCGMAVSEKVSGFREGFQSLSVAVREDSITVEQGVQMACALAKVEGLPLTMRDAKLEFQSIVANRMRADNAPPDTIALVLALILNGKIEEAEDGSVAFQSRISAADIAKIHADLRDKTK
jgi:hypothetical protein